MAEIAQRAESVLKSNLRNLHLGIRFQHFDRPFQTRIQNQFIRRHAAQRFQLVVERAAADGQFLRQHIHIKIGIAQMIFYNLLQLGQELGIYR